MAAARPRRRLLLFIPALGLAAGLGVRLTAGADPAPASAPASAPAPAAVHRAPPAAARDQRPAQQTVTIGLYLQNIPEIDIKTNSFHAEFYLWFLWRGDNDPTLTYQLTNAVNLSDLSRTPTFVDAAGAAKPDVLPDGRRYQVFHVYGRFGQPFPLARYPLDDHELVISIEDARHPLAELVHRIDHRDTAMRPGLTIPGWQLSPMRATAGRSRFATNFGDPRFSGGQETYSRVDFALHVARPAVGLVSKTVIPIALIILITFGAFFCQPEDIDARLCLTITALISAVALQFTAATELPPTGGLILLDKIYILSYLMILAVSFCCIAANRLVHREQPERARRLDRIGLWCSASGYFGVLALLLLTH